MQTVLHIIRKEIRQIRRTREMLAIIFVMPLIQMLVLGFAISTEVKNISLLTADYDNSVLSKELVAAFDRTNRFTLLSRESSLSEIEQAIHGWQAQMGIIIPPGFERDLRSGRTPGIQFIVDGLDGNTAGVASGYANQILQEVVANASRSKAALPAPKTRMWYNLNLSPAQYMVPGIIVVLLTMITMMLSAMGLVREKELGTLEQLMVTPIKRYQLILGKLLPFLVLAMVELVIVLQFARFIFDIEITGSFLLLAALAVVYLFTTLGLGIWVSTITSTQQQAMFISWFFMVTMLLMSGFLIPIENMPEFLQNATYLNPMRYFMYIVRDIIQKGSSLPMLRQDVIPLALFGISIFTLAVMSFQKRVR